MRNTMQFASRIAMAAAATALVGASAFAESRPSKETRERARGTNIVRSGSSVEVRGRDASANRSARGSDRSAARDGVDRRDRVQTRERRETARDRRDERRSTGARRGHDNRRQDHRRREVRRSYNHRQPYYAHGRVSRVGRYRSGYRVWLHGSRYPFFVPAAHYHRDRFRIGLMINLGGYYNPAGYYDYYDYGVRAQSRGELRGIVESVDYRRDTFVIRNEASGSFVTVVMRDRRREFRPGDYVEVYGDWSRSGVFRAYDVDLLDYRRY